MNKSEQITVSSGFLYELDRKKTQKAVEDAFDKYRICKFLTFEEKEAGTTASYNERLHGPTNELSDQTGNIAVHNVDVLAARRKYCVRIERAVHRLPKMEKLLVTERYLSEDAEYITDYHVYCYQFEPPISEGTYSKIRWRAFYKLALDLKIGVEKESN